MFGSMEFENADGDSMKSEERAIKHELANQPAHDPNNYNHLNDS